MRDPLVAELRVGVTTFAMDRRGFGASGDASDYSTEREFEDAAAVAARTGGPVARRGHSYGAHCAMGGAALTSNVDRLLLYEASLGLTYPAGSIEAVGQALAAGDREGAIRLVSVASASPRAWVRGVEDPGRLEDQLRAQQLGQEHQAVAAVHDDVVVADDAEHRSLSWRTVASWPATAWPSARNSGSLATVHAARRPRAPPPASAGDGPGRRQGGARACVARS